MVGANQKIREWLHDSEGDRNFRNFLPSDETIDTVRNIFNSVAEPVCRSSIGLKPLITIESVKTNWKALLYPLWIMLRKFEENSSAQVQTIATKPSRSFLREKLNNLLLQHPRLHPSLNHKKKIEKALFKAFGTQQAFIPTAYLLQENLQDRDLEQLANLVEKLHQLCDEIRASIDAGTFTMMKYIDTRGFRCFTLLPNFSTLFRHMPMDTTLLMGVLKKNLLRMGTVKVFKNSTSQHVNSLLTFFFRINTLLMKRSKFGTMLLICTKISRNLSIPMIPPETETKPKHSISPLKPTV